MVRRPPSSTLTATPVPSAVLFLACAPAAGTGSAVTDATATSSTPAGATGSGLATLTADGRVLDVWYPAPELGRTGEASETFRLDPVAAENLLGAAAAPALGTDPVRGDRKSKRLNSSH